MEVEKGPPPAADKEKKSLESASSPISQSGSHGRPKLLIPPPTTPPRDLRSAGLERGLTMSKSTFAGFCLTAFACGIVTTVALDRVWPRMEGDGGRAEQTAAMQVRPDVQVVAPVPVAPMPPQQAEPARDERPMEKAEVPPAFALKETAAVKVEAPKLPRVAGSPTPIARKRVAARPAPSEPVGRTTSTSSVDEAGKLDEDAPLPPKAKWTDPFE
jgi:hypothetical protein